MSGKLRELTNDDFGTATASGTVLVDFWAPWCGPCRMQTPILEALAEELGDALTICKVNVDEAQQPAVMFGIESIPTLILFKDGKPVKKFVGLQQAATIKANL